MMRLVLVAAMLLYLTMPSKELQIDSLEDVLVYPVEPSMNAEKQTVSKQKSMQRDAAFHKFIEEKLIQQTQALEHIYKMVTANEELTKQLLDNLSTKVRRPELPEKVEPVTAKQTRRRDIGEEISNPFIKIGQNIPKYGRLFKDLVLKELHNDPDPTPLVDLDSASAELLTRRSFSDSPRAVPAIDSLKVSPWCTIALLCRRSMKPICGYDDNFGYGKFDDLCHMMQVNCYWKYNFALVLSCKPTL